MKIEKKKKGKPTDAGPVEHQISRLAIAQTPENRDGTEHSSGDDDVAYPWCPFGKHMVISSRDP